ncbi:hypothetical protein B0T13DRAFT_184501 [Neurospora crassa]|nr:hypothetical protein B0T13DRAFT_184501 [Neurospora crassa]
MNQVLRCVSNLSCSPKKARVWAAKHPLEAALLVLVVSGVLIVLFPFSLIAIGFACKGVSKSKSAAVYMKLLSASANARYTAARYYRKCMAILDWKRSKRKHFCMHPEQNHGWSGCFHSCSLDLYRCPGYRCLRSYRFRYHEAEYRRASSHKGETLI